MALPPVLDYAGEMPRQGAGLKSLLGLAGFVVSFLNMNLTACMCGYQGLESVPGNLLGLGLAVGAFVLGSRGLVGRGLAAFAVIVCTLILTTNVHNVLWSGHHPLFP